MHINTTVSSVLWLIQQSGKNLQTGETRPLEIALDTTINQDKNNNISLPIHGTELIITTNYSEKELDKYPTVSQTSIAVILMIFCIITVFGNVLVMVAILKQQYLHTVTNYFIASLATADCLVGAVVMPFSIIHEVMDKYWLFGREWCDLWRSLDVLASTASILNLCAISIDRYWAITDPMTYPSKMTQSRAKAIVGIVWLCSALISFPAIAWWRAVSVQPYPENECLFTNDVGYLLFSSIISFYGPLCVMVFTYYKIYKAAVSQTKSLKLGMKHVTATDESSRSMTLRIHRGGFHEQTKPENNQLDVKPKRHLVITSPGSSPNGETSVAKSPDGLAPMRLASRHGKAFSLSKKLGKLTKERKAAKTLGIVMGVFILCWLPFFIINVLFGICGTSCISEPELVSSIVTWLGWLNSGMNPVIYACWSRDFRRAFRQLLCSCCRIKRQQYRFQTTIRTNIPPRSKSPNEEVFL